MKKVPIHSRVPQSIKDAIDKQAKENFVTPSKHIGNIVAKHVSKQEIKSNGKKEYDDR